ncbi:hypothetical protein Bca4012_065399 [Brassica carinata]|uniref:Uncharacterized protein n=1 Tax=Brassica carinata TaxID=52824 RepID=A0A8X8AYN0_BRACI|nr:hypothetical protein Bca52824_017744 [Brassica carinata]
MPSIDNPLPFRPIIPNFVNVYNSFDFVFIKGVQNFGDTGRFVIEANILEGIEGKGVAPPAGSIGALKKRRDIY